MAEKEYIEREAAIKALHDNTVEMEQTIAYPSNIGVPEDDIEDIINEIPAADVVEVVHAHWVEMPHYPPTYRCARCAYGINKKKREHNYCPNCGADMRGERKCEDG